MKNKKIIAVICAVCLFVTALAACKTTGGNGGTGPAASGTNIGDKEPNIKPSTLPEPKYGETRDFELSIEGTKETVTMTYTQLNYATKGSSAKNLAIFVDTERYAVISTDDGYRIVPVGNEDSPIAQINFAQYKDQTAQELAESVKTRTQELGDKIINEGERTLDNYTAQYLETSNARAYYIDYKGGCLLVGIGLFTPEAREGHAVRLEEMAKTIKILEK